MCATNGGGMKARGKGGKSLTLLDNFVVCQLSLRLDPSRLSLQFTRRMADILRVGFIMADRFRQKAVCCWLSQ